MRGQRRVTAAIFIIGPMAILPMNGLRSIRAESAPQVASIARSTRLVGWLSLIVAVLGFALVPFVDPEDGLTYGTPWLAASITLTTLLLVAVVVLMVWRP